MQPSPILTAATPSGLPLPDYPNHRIEVKYATEHRCGVVIKGPGLSDAITDTDPLKDNLPLRKSTGTDGTPEVRSPPLPSSNKLLQFLLKQSCISTFQQSRHLS